MFLQEIINKKINDQDDIEMDDEMVTGMGSTHMHSTKKRKMNVIGSVKNSSINYPKDQKFFHANDIPDKAKDAVKEVKEAIDKDIFKLKQPKWNPSVSKVNLPIDDNHPQKLFEIRKGLKDFFPLDTKHGKVYEGTDSRDIYHDGWNVSNQVPIPLHRQKMIYEETAMRVSKTKEFNEKNLKNYKSPFKLANEHSETIKTQRVDEQDWKSTIRDQVEKMMPNATIQKKDAVAFRTLYEEKHKKQEFEDDYELTFKPDLKQTLRSRRKRVYHHTGKWEKSKFDDQEAWSCCMNYDKDSEGCNVKIVDMDKYNLVSF